MKYEIQKIFLKKTEQPNIKTVKFYGYGTYLYLQ